MSAAMTLASCGGTKDAGQQQDAATLIQRSDIKIEGKRMTPEALWAMGRIGSMAYPPTKSRLPTRYLITACPRTRVTAKSSS